MSWYNWPNLISIHHIYLQSMATGGFQWNFSVAIATIAFIYIYVLIFHFTNVSNEILLVSAKLIISSSLRLLPWWLFWDFGPKEFIALWSISWHTNFHLISTCQLVWQEVTLEGFSVKFSLWQMIFLFYFGPSITPMLQMKSRVPMDKAASKELLFEVLWWPL